MLKGSTLSWRVPIALGLALFVLIGYRLNGSYISPVSVPMGVPVAIPVGIPVINYLVQEEESIAPLNASAAVVRTAQPLLILKEIRTQPRWNELNFTGMKVHICQHHSGIRRELEYVFYGSQITQLDATFANHSIPTEEPCNIPDIYVFSVFPLNAMRILHQLKTHHGKVTCGGRAYAPIVVVHIPIRVLMKYGMTLYDILPMSPASVFQSQIASGSAVVVFNNWADYYIATRRVGHWDCPEGIVQSFLVEPIPASVIGPIGVPISFLVPQTIEIDMSKPVAIISHIVHAMPLMRTAIKYLTAVGHSYTVLPSSTYGGALGLRRYKSLLYLPYEISVMIVPECLTSGVRVIIPSARLWNAEIEKCIQEEMKRTNRTYHRSLCYQFFNQGSHVLWKERATTWYRDVDFYLPEMEGLIDIFDTWEHMVELLDENASTIIRKISDRESLAMLRVENMLIKWNNLKLVTMATIPIEERSALVQPLNKELLQEATVRYRTISSMEERASKCRLSKKQPAPSTPPWLNDLLIGK